MRLVVTFHCANAAKVRGTGRRSQTIGIEHRFPHTLEHRDQEPFFMTSANPKARNARRQVIAMMPKDGIGADQVVLEKLR
jgi:hypothetical protein